MIKRRTPKPQLRLGVSLENALELAHQSKKLLQNEENFGDQDEVRPDRKRKRKYVTKKVYNISEYDASRLECCQTFKCISKVPYETLIRFRNDMTEAKTEREKSKLVTNFCKNCYDDEKKVFVWRVGQIKLCIKAVCHIFNISMTKLYRIMNSKEEKFILLHGNSLSIHTANKTNECEQWLRQRCNDFADWNPEKLELHFPTILPIKDLYAMYLDCDNIVETVSITTFTGLIYKLNIIFPRNSRLGKCDLCILYNERLFRTKNDQVSKEYKKNYANIQNHLVNVKERKHLYQSRIEKARNNIKVNHSFIIDQSHDINLPWFVPLPKSLSCHGNNAIPFSFGCVLDNGFLLIYSLSGLNLPTFYCLPNLWKGDANYYCSVFFHYLEIRYKEEKYFPQKSFLQLDNCTKENKNKYFFLLCALLVYKGYTNEMTLDYMNPGHTHDNVDQFFSLMRIYLISHEVHTYEGLINAFKEVYSGSDKHEDANIIHDFTNLPIYDWKSYFQAYGMRFSGHTDAYQYKFFLKDQKVFMKCRYDPIYGKWSKSFPIFEDISLGQPNLILPHARNYKNMMETINSVRTIHKGGITYTKLSNEQYEQWEDLWNVLDPLVDVEFDVEYLHQDDIFYWLNKRIYKTSAQRQRVLPDIDDIPIKFKDVINIGDIVAIKGNGFGNVIEVWFALVEGETVSQFHIKYLNEQDLIEGKFIYSVAIKRNTIRKEAVYFKMFKVTRDEVENLYRIPETVVEMAVKWANICENYSKKKKK